MAAGAYLRKLDVKCDRDSVVNNRTMWKLFLAQGERAGDGAGAMGRGGSSRRSRRPRRQRNGFLWVHILLCRINTHRQCTRA